MFFDRLKSLCDEKGISTYKAATDIGLNRSSVNKWKKGATPRGSVAALLASYFGVSVDYLLGNEKSAPAGDGETAEKSEEDAQMKALADKIGQLSESKRKILENLLDAMLEE